MDQSFSKKIEDFFSEAHIGNHMALIRVSGRPQVSGENLASRDIPINNSHVVDGTPDHNKPKKRDAHMHGGDVLIVDISGEDVEILIRQEN